VYVPQGQPDAYSSSVFIWLSSHSAFMKQLRNQPSDLYPCIAAKLCRKLGGTQATFSGDPALNLDRKMGHPDWGASSFPTSSYANTEIVAQIKPRRPPSTSFPIHYRLFIPSVVATQATLLTAPQDRSVVDTVLLPSIQTSSSAILPPVQWAQGIISLWVKLPGCELEHSLLSNDYQQSPPVNNPSLRGT
jgi:hypothetical protein